MKGNRDTGQFIPILLNFPRTQHVPFLIDQSQGRKIQNRRFSFKEGTQGSFLSLIRLDADHTVCQHFQIHRHLGKAVVKVRGQLERHTVDIHFRPTGNRPLQAERIPDQEDTYSDNNGGQKDQRLFRTE